MSKMKRPVFPARDSMTDISPAVDTGVIIGITYLDKNKFNLETLFKASRGDSRYIKDFQSFLHKSRKYNGIQELIKNHKPHSKLYNSDKLSLSKVKELSDNYSIELDGLIHIHCDRDGNGSFVLHGFVVSNCFQIVWLDPKHEIHDS